LIPINALKWHPKVRFISYFIQGCGIIVVFIHILCFIQDAGLLASAGSIGIKIWKVEGEVVYLLDPSATAVKRGPPVKRGKKSTIGKDATKRMEPCGFA
jgi:hypothetical protein